MFYNLIYVLFSNYKEDGSVLGTRRSFNEEKIYSFSRETKKTIHGFIINTNV
jgi:hypothetical protein